MRFKLSVPYFLAAKIHEYVDWTVEQIELGAVSVALLETIRKDTGKQAPSVPAPPAPQMSR